MTTRPQDDVNQHDVQTMIDDHAAGISRDVALTSLRAYTIEQLTNMSEQEHKQLLKLLLAVDESLFLGPVSVEIIDNLDGDDALMMVTDIWRNS